MAKRNMRNKYASTQNFVPIDDISDGIVKLRNGNYIKTLEITPTNFHMMGVIEQNNLIDAFVAFHKIAPIHLQFKVLTMPAESSEHIDIVKKAALADTSPGFEERKKHMEQYVALTDRLSRYTAVTRRFFIIFKYEYTEEMGSEYIDIVSSINSTAQRIQEYLSGCGNYVIQHNNIDDENRFQAEIFYLLFNRKSNIPFTKHVKQVVETFMQQQGLIPGQDEVPDIPVTNFIAPRHINLSHKDWIYIDGTFYAFYIISGKSYPTTVYATWLDDLINFGAGVDVDIFSERFNKADIQEKLCRTLAYTKVKMNETNETNRDFEVVKDALQSVHYIKNKLSGSNEDFYNMSTLITITSDSVKGLRKRIRQVRDLLRSKDMTPISCFLRYEQAFLSTLPCALIAPVLKTPAERNILTRGLASIYPLTSYEVCHKDGIMLGINTMNNSLFTVNIFNTQYFQNANMMILGSTGAGKTYTLGMIMSRLRMRGIQTFLVAPDKGHEFRRMCNRLGGTFVKICAGSPACVNVLDIHPINDKTDIEIEGEEGAYKDSLLSNKIEDLKIFFTLLIPKITEIELQRLDAIFIKTYEHAGITDDNDSIYIDKSSKTLRPMPTLEDVYNNLQTSQNMENIAIILKPLVFGSAKNFNGQTNVDLKNKLVVFDISKLKGNLKPAGMFMVTDYIMSQIKSNRSENNALIIDELWRLISENPYAAEYVKQIWKTIRGYGGAAIGATQDLNDYFALNDGKYGKAIISASAINILKKTKPIEAKLIRDVMDLTDEEYKKLTRLSKSQGLFCTDTIHMEIEFMATAFEHWNITTDAKDLRKLQEVGYEALVG